MQGQSVVFHSFDDYLLSAYYVPHAGLEPGTTAVKTQVKYLLFQSLHSTESRKN